MTYIGLLRGINVGGRNILPMKELVALLESLGASNIRTYIQSGNVTLEIKENDAKRLSRRLATSIKQTYGFEPLVLFIKRLDFDRVIGSNPFPEAETKPKTLHVFFLATKPTNPNLDLLESLRGDKERIVLKEEVLYLHAPDGIGRSRLVSGLEKALGVAVTGRNWRTICKLQEMGLER